MNTLHDFEKLRQIFLNDALNLLRNTKARETCRETCFVDLCMK